MTHQTTFSEFVQHVFAENSKKISRKALAAKIIMTLAHQLIRFETDLTLAGAITFAADVYRHNRDDLHLVEFYDTHGNRKQRVVCTDWIGEWKGTGRPLKPGQRIFLDVARELTDQRLIFISCYENLIINLY